MPEHKLNFVSFRRCVVMLCLTLIAGCLPRTNNPAAPVPVGVAAVGGDAVVTLTWTASTGATSYNVKRATTSGGPYVKLATVTMPTFTDSSVANGTAYFYVVSALNAAGESANSAEVSATPKAAPPAAPANLTAVAGNAEVSLTWSASGGATSYHVKRATTSGGPYTQLGTPTSASYTDTQVTNGVTYYYVVSALNSAGESANSAQVSATPNPNLTTGTWTNVTPAGVDLTDTLSCSNFGTQSVQVDLAHPSNVYTQFHCQGIWKSTDYGMTWTGPINTGNNAAPVTDCAGGIAVAPDSTAAVPTVYESCIRGSGLGFWKSTDGGVNWTQYVIAPTSRQDYWPPVFDPYDVNHLLMSAHEFNSLVESVDGGQTWTSIPLASGMLQTGATGFLFFINTGTASSTRTTWLWIGQSNAGTIGTWRTTDSGATWVMVDKNEHVGGSTQIYQPDNSGVVFMTGGNSALGSGVLRSTDYGQTWSHEGVNTAESVIIGTSNEIYAMFGAPVGPGATVNPAFELAAPPGTGTWTMPGTPTAMTQGPAQLALVNDGTHNIVLGANWNAGVWRYVEP